MEGREGGRDQSSGGGSEWREEAESGKRGEGRSSVEREEREGGRGGGREGGSKQASDDTTEGSV